MACTGRAVVGSGSAAVVVGANPGQPVQYVRSSTSSIPIGQVRRVVYVRPGEQERPGSLGPSADVLSRFTNAHGNFAAMDSLDFDEEARKLWARLNLDPTRVNGGQYNALDPLWRHPESGGTFFVGNQTAAANLMVLQQFNITHVVNCTDSMPLYHDQPDGPIKYFRFDICGHYRRARTDAEAVAFAEPVLKWVENALARGHNVMAHCLAGAHRAGTTGVMCLMYFANLSARDAVPIAKRCRPIIDPIGEFPEFLMKLERGWKSRAAGKPEPAPVKAAKNASEVPDEHQ